MKIRKNSSYKLSNLLSYSSGLCSSSAAAAHEQKHVRTETSHFYIPLKCHATQSAAVCVFSEDFWVLKHINKHNTLELVMCIHPGYTNLHAMRVCVHFEQKAE